MPFELSLPRLRLLRVSVSRERRPIHFHKNISCSALMAGAVQVSRVVALLISFACSSSVNCVSTMKIRDLRDATN
jgi:hypothetical protein